jgi:hypothetical protein
MRLPSFALLAVFAFSTGAFAKLPAPSPEAKAKADEAAARSSWNDKLGAYQLCVSMERTAEAYRAQRMTLGKEAPAAEPTPPCSDPGPFAYTPTPAKPLEASEAHSPAANATSPPSTPATAAQLQGQKK